MSGDASRIYFASRQALGGVNAEGRSAVAGEANLYFYEAGEPSGSIRFIGALAAQDLFTPSPINGNQQYHIARVSGDGESAVFMSYARLTGYDNTDRSSGQRDAELFVYDARGDEGKGRVVCASCNPSGARPAGQRFQAGSFPTRGPWVAARVPVPEDVLYASRVLSANGRRLFFDSYDALSPGDGNGRQDVYEWEAPGEGTCTEQSGSFSPRNGGCVGLVSSGQSSVDSEFVDASPDGHGVFFTTESSLVPWDYGLQDVYDARVDGGLPEPFKAPSGCEGEACQAPAGPSGYVTPSSSTFEGGGNMLVSPVVSGGVKARALTRAQRLTAALKACRRVKNKHKRVVCERTARKRYRTNTKTARTVKHGSGR